MCVGAGGTGRGLIAREESCIKRMRVKGKEHDGRILPEQV